MNFLSKIGLEERLIIELPIEQDDFLERLAIDFGQAEEKRIRIPNLYQGKLDNDQFVIERKKGTHNFGIHDTSEDHSICEGRWGKKEEKTILVCNIKALNHTAFKHLLIQQVAGFVGLLGLLMAIGALNIGIFIAFIIFITFLRLFILFKQAKKMKRDMQSYFKNLITNEG